MSEIAFESGETQETWNTRRAIQEFIGMLEEIYESGAEPDWVWDKDGNLIVPKRQIGRFK